MQNLSVNRVQRASPAVLLCYFRVHSCLAAYLLAALLLLLLLHALGNADCSGSEMLKGAAE